MQEYNNMTFEDNLWAHNKNLALIMASRKSRFYKNVRVRKRKTKNFGEIFEVISGGLKD